MSEATIADTPTTNPPRAVNVPPGPRLPRLAQGLGFVLFRRKFTGRLVRRYGDVATMHLPVFGHMVTVADPQLAKQLFMAGTDEVGNIQPNLSRLFGSGSVFALDGADHRRRRKLLTPPFHGKSIKNYETIFEEETLREAQSWPDGQEFETLEPMMRITLNVILRAVFGADGERLDELRDIIPPWVTLGSKLAMAPIPPRALGHVGPWGRLADYRRRYDAVVDRLIDDVLADGTADGAAAQRDDILTLLLHSTYEDGSAMTRREIADELLTLLAAGHETTASTLAWAFERISRHPEVLDALVAEAATGDNEYRQATILEVQRARTVIDGAARHVYAPTFQLGEWVIPQGYSIRVDISNIHERSLEFPDPEKFDPQRFMGKRPSTFAWLPFGGGTRRCVGAAFANVEMDVVLRTVLRHFVVETSTAPDEKVHCRGVAFTPKKGGRAVLRRRPTPLA
jgi:cytochrome P450